MKIKYETTDDTINKLQQLKLRTKLNFFKIIVTIMIK